MLKSGDYRFSLSGLKTAVITYIRQQEESDTPLNIPDLAASFQQAVIDVQVAKTVAAARETGAAHVILAGGVAANQALREALTAALDQAGIRISVPPPAYCGDNAAMIARAATARLMAVETGDLDALVPLALTAEAVAQAPLDADRET
jgi:N6-L-threonylcarbamoyladenine synthase